MGEATAAGGGRIPHCFGRKGLSVYRKQNDRRLLSVRSSDIAFTMGAKGRCWKRRRSWTVRYRSFEKSKACRSYGVCAAVALGMMLVGAVGMKLVPPQYFGVVERFSVFAATGFNAALGIHLFREENAGETQNDQEEKP